jgi:hypothetical protein
MILNSKKNCPKGISLSYLYLPVILYLFAFFSYPFSTWQLNTFFKMKHKDEKDIVRG